MVSRAKIVEDLESKRMNIDKTIRDLNKSLKQNIKANSKNLKAASLFVAVGVFVSIVGIAYLIKQK